MSRAATQSRWRPAHRKTRSVFADKAAESVAGFKPVSFSPTLSAGV
ncbi:MAG: hypothetical protein FWF45_02820 [Coriobacteriia bacterium]|nr:hypothetical protein [Coriobacteriia bacterium]